MLCMGSPDKCVKLKGVCQLHNLRCDAAHPDPRKALTSRFRCRDIKVISCGCLAGWPVRQGRIYYRVLTDKVKKEGIIFIHLRKGPHKECGNLKYPL